MTRTAGRRADRNRTHTKAVRPAPRPAVPSPPRAGGLDGGAGAPLDTRALAIHLGLFLIAAVVLALRSHGAYHDDDLDHYFMARAAFRQPHFLIDTWGRPAFTILYALPAQLGWLVTRLFTVALALLAAILTARAAARIGFRHAWLAAGLAVWQPLFYRLSSSALAEPLAALLIAALLWAVAEERDDLAGWMAGLLPLARLELIVVVPVVAIWLIGRRNWRPLLWLVAPLLLWAIVGGVAYGDPLWLAHAIRGAERPLRSAGPLHYFRNFITVAGPAAFLGLFLGVAAMLVNRERPRPLFAALVGGIVFAVLTALTWEALPLGASIGFLRHLIVLAAPLGLMAAAGYEWAARESDSRRRAAAAVVVLVVAAVVALWLSHQLEADFIVRAGHDWSRLIGLAPVALLVLLALFGFPGGGRRPGLRPAWGHALVVSAALFCILTVRPIDLNVEQKTVRTAVNYLRQEGLLNRPLMANHPWFYFLTGRERWDRAATPYVTRQTLASAPAGALIFWENHYGQRLYGDVPVNELRGDPRYRLLFEVESGDRQFRVTVFEKAS